jgi:hypothetical protein
VSRQAAEYGLVFEEPPAHPGQWARVARFKATHSAPSMASMLRTGRRPRPAGCWLFEGRLNDAGGSDLYALFEGAGESETPYAHPCPADATGAAS